LIDEDLSASDLLNLAEDTDISDTLGAVTRDGNIKTLPAGDENRGWIHTQGRHIEGTLDTERFTSFFPSGQTITRNGQEVTLNPVLSESGVQRTIMNTIRRGDIDTDDGGPGVVYQCNPGNRCYTPEENIGTIRVVIGDDRRVITAYPEEGPDTVAWDPTEGWQNVGE